MKKIILLVILFGIGSLYAWAVRYGDVYSVPEPAYLLLIGLGILGIAALMRKKL